MDFEIKALDKTTLPDQLVVYRAAFNATKDYEENNAVWIKKHYENPLGDSLVFGAYYEGKLVGMNSYMPVEYVYEGEVIPMLQSCESGVLPEYQGKGIWSKVVKYAVNYVFRNTKYQAVIGFPNYINSYPGFKKMGWETLFDMNNYVLVNNPKEFSRNLFKGKKALQIIGRLIFIQRTGVWLLGCGYNKYEINECVLDDLIWDDNQNVLSVTHSDELLEWKKSYKNIKTVAIKADGKTIATGIYSFGEYDGAQIIKLEKCVLCETSSISLQKAVALICKYLAQKYPHIAFIRVWTLQKSALESAMKRLLFLKSSHPNPFIIKQDTKSFSDKKWNLSFFDLD